MFIKQLQIRNFKSIREAEIQFTPLCMIVGANAAGKSNLINVFRFLGNIVSEGIENAVALQGGMPNLINANMPKGTPVDIHFVLDLSSEEWVRNIRNSSIALHADELEYHFILQPHLKGTGFRIAEDYLKLSFSHVPSDDEADVDIHYSMCFHRKSTSGKIQSTVDIQGNDVTAEAEKILNNDIVVEFFSDWANHTKKELMFYRVSVLLPPSFSDSSFIRIFDFDPKELKRASAMASIKSLSENGSNIASVLQGILRNKEKRDKLQTLLKRFLPFIQSVSIENNMDKSFSYKVKESFSNRYFHANFLSDGTVSILAVIIALYFEDRSDIIILEEPERNIHPKLLSSILSAAEDVSIEKQVIITTHNPEFLKHAQIENIRIVERDPQGYTKIKEPQSSAAVRCFIENSLGLDDLFINDMLGE